MREKRKAPVGISQIVGRTTNRLGLKEGIASHRIMDRWEDIVGEGVASHARPARMHRGTLVVRVESSPWMQELSFMKVTLVEQLKRTMPAVPLKGIRFEVGELPALSPAALQPARATSSRPLKEDEKEFVERSVERISDTELRDLARRAMTRGFERGSKRDA
ncbi:MAG: DUF721 domain-containing protein [Pseudomonadota bacterium]